MSDNRQPSRPSHIAYQVNEGQEGKSYFNRVGAAFAHRDGQGYNVVLDAVPMNGHVTLRTPQERLDQMRNEPQHQPQQAQQQARAQQDAHSQQQAQPQRQAQAAPSQGHER